MSAIFRFARFGNLGRRGLTAATSKHIPCLQRAIGTSPHKKDTSPTAGINEPYLPKKPWVSYGFVDDDQEADTHFMHTTLFFTITIALVGIAVYYIYVPDDSLRDWAQREAFLQMRYKEEHGLPYVSPDLIDPAKIVLPSDEELGDTDIII